MAPENVENSLAPCTRGCFTFLGRCWGRRTGLSARSFVPSTQLTIKRLDVDEPTSVVAMLAASETADQHKPLGLMVRKAEAQRCLSDAYSSDRICHHRLRRIVWLLAREQHGKAERPEDGVSLRESAGHFPHCVELLEFSETL